MFSAVTLLVTGLNEAASLLSFTEAVVLGPLCASAVAWLAFFISQWHASRPSSRVEPVLPWRFLQDRVMVGLLLYVSGALTHHVSLLGPCSDGPQKMQTDRARSNAFCTGAVSITCIFQLPLRYQAAADLSPLEAGIRLIPFAVCGPVATITCTALSKNKRVPPLYLGIFGALLQIIGLVFMSRGKLDDPQWPALYGFEVLAGLGFGCCIAMATLLCPFIVEKNDLGM